MSGANRQARRFRRTRIQARNNREKRKEFAYTLIRGAEWIVLFFGLMVTLVAALVLFLLGEYVYAGLFLLFGLFVGTALLKRQSARVPTRTQQVPTPKPGPLKKQAHSKNRSAA
jgi:4-hydroxybenzoate polyprenyltransferase